MPASLTSNYGFYYGWTLGEDGWNTGNDSNWQSLDNLINTLWNARGLRPVVRAASTGNMALTGTAPLTVDGIALVHQDRVLLKNQTDGRQNGIYEAIFSGSNYTLTRPSDANTQNGLLGCFVWVTEGTQASTGWLQTTKAPITVDATALTWTNVLTAPSATPGTYGSASKTLAVTVSSTGAVTGITEYNLSTANIAEATNLYYTDVRARAALSGTSPIGYNSTSGAISIQTASGSQAGALSSTDWSTFNGKEGDLGTGTSGQFLKHDKSWGAVDYSVLSNVPSTFTPASHSNTAHSETYITSAGVTYEALNSNSDIGTTSGTVCAGDDSRLSNSRTPTSHATSHQHSGSDEIATATAAANAIPKAGADNKLAIGWVPTGTDANSVCIGNDARLSDARTPTAHTTSHKHGGSDEVATATAAANAIPKAGADNKLAIGWIPTGTDANSVCIGNDARLSDARTPTSHVHAGSDITSSTVGTTYGGTGLSSIGTANQVLGANATATGLEYKTITATANRVSVTHAAGSITLSTPQDIHTGASPTFAGATIGSLTGLIKGATGVLSAATAGTDYTVGSTGLAGGQTIAGGTLTTQDLTLRGNAADTTTGAVKITTSTASTSTTTGSLINAGGFGNAGAFYCGGAAVVTGNVTCQSGQMTVGTSAAGEITLIMNAAATNQRTLAFRTANVNRWFFGATADAESGSDAGSNFVVSARTDAGVAIDNPVSIVRAAGGAITLARPTSVTDTTEATTHTEASLKTAGGLAVAKRICSPKMFITEEGGFAVRLTAGEALTRGNVVYVAAAGGADGKVWKNPIDGDMPVGVVFQNASADAEVVVITSGIAYVLPDTTLTATRGYVIYSSATTAGLVAEAASVPVAATHFRECGHWLDTGSGAGAITRALVHFN